MTSAFPPEFWAFLPLGAAVGLDLHLVVLFLGTAPFLGWDTPLPGGLDGLSSPPALAMAALLYLAEGTVERFPVASLVWNGVHLLVRPLAAALLALLLLQDTPLAWSLTGGVVAAAGALAVQWVRGGWRLLLEFTDARGSTRLVASGAEDAAALALAVLVLDLPAGGALVTVLLFGLAGFHSRPYLEAFTFGLHLLRFRTIGFLERSPWRPFSSLSGRTRAVLSRSAPGGWAETLRATPIGVVRPETSGIFARGWLVQSANALGLVTRKGIPPDGFELDSEVDRGHLLSPRELYDRLEFRHGGKSVIVLLPRGGPDPRLVAEATRT